MLLQTSNVNAYPTEGNMIWYTISYTTWGLPTGLKCVCGCCFICFLVWIVSLWGRWWGGRKQNQHTRTHTCTGRSRINRWADKRANTHRQAVFTVTPLRPDCLHLSKLKAASTLTLSSKQHLLISLVFIFYTSCVKYYKHSETVIYIDTDQDLQPYNKKCLLTLLLCCSKIS